MGETGHHVMVTVEMIAALRTILRHREDVYVGGDLFIYFQEGDPKQVVCPDVFVAFGTARHERRTWKTWEEGGKFPDLIIEIVSDSSRLLDTATKRGGYEGLGVTEYFLFDPERNRPGPALWGFARKGGRFVPMKPQRLPSGEVRLTSRLLRHTLQSEGSRIRLRDARTGQAVLRLDEEVEARRREAEAHRREIERLRKQLAKARGRHPGKK